jgi:TrmH family RNA methyltransferase
MTTRGFLTERFSLSEFDFPCYLLSAALFDSLCDVRTPQGILAVMEKPPEAEGDLPEKGFYLFCDRVSDPGNLGAMLRTAYAAGFSGALLGEGCADAYAPKTVRATMGALFHLTVLQKEYDFLLRQRRRGYKLIASALMDGAKNLFYAKFGPRTILIVGSEAEGVSKGLLPYCDAVVKIPMPGGAESLNAAVAAGLLMYEVVRKI